MSKIGKAGPNNAAILDTEKSVIEKGDAKILVVDEELANKLTFIREGEFVEKKGATTLKLVGDVVPIEKVDVIKKVKENLIKEYPLSATELIEEIKKKIPECKQGEIHKIIRENKIKDDSEYCHYMRANLSLAFIAGYKHCEKTMYNEEVSSAPGSVSQVRESTNAFMQLAKGLGISIFLVGHVTKEGTVAGPRVLEHMVDTVLYFEGDRHASYRILRGVKNRFGSTNEIGVFEMKQTGLEEVENPSEFMLNGKPENASGSVVACSMEGTRPILMEIQALVCQSNFGMPRRTAAGTDYNRVNLLMAVLEKRIGLQLSNYDAYINIAGGIKMNEPAVDLGIIMAIVSSYKNKPIDERTIVFGEVGLSGEVRGVTMPEQRVAEAKKLGFKTCIVPMVSRDLVKNIKGVEIIGVKTINEAINLL